MYLVIYFLADRMGEKSYMCRFETLEIAREFIKTLDSLVFNCEIYKETIDGELRRVEWK